MADWKKQYKKRVQQALAAHNGYAPALALIDIISVYNTSSGDMVLHVHINRAYYLITLYSNGLYGSHVVRIK